MAGVQSDGLLDGISQAIVCDIALDAIDPTFLLLKAVRSLPAEEQDVVLAWLFSTVTATAPVIEPRTTAAPAGVSQRDWLMPEHVERLVAAKTQFGQPTLGEAQVVPVRFPVGLYEQLKTWSTENGFPIAAIVRGLVEKFLDEQQTRPAADS